MARQDNPADAGTAPPGPVLFSVVVPCFERAALLGSALESVAAQGASDAECIVVDDGSTPPLEPQSAAGTLPVRWLRQDNLGPAGARNAGAAVATGRYLVFLDSDDRLAPFALETYRAAIDAHPDAVLLAAAHVGFADTDDVTFDPTPPVTEAFGDYLAASGDWRGLGAGTAVVDRRVFAECGGFDATFRHGEELDLGLRLGTAGEFVQIRAPATVAVRRHAGNLSHDRESGARAVLALIAHEREGRYPGGPSRRAARRRMLARDARPVVLAGLEAGAFGAALAVYWRSLAWQVADRRFAFILGALPAGLFRALRRRVAGSDTRA